MFLVGSLSESIGGRFCPRGVLLLVGFESAVRAVREFISDAEAEERRLGEKRGE